jgi:hypothetical protein
MNDGFLDFEGLTQVSAEIKTRVKSVKALPALPTETTDEAVYLYVGEDTSNYKKGHIYQAHTYFAIGDAGHMAYFNTPNVTQDSQVVAESSNGDPSLVGWWFHSFGDGYTILCRVKGSDDEEDQIMLDGVRYPAGDYVDWTQVGVTETPEQNLVIVNQLPAWADADASKLYAVKQAGVPYTTVYITRTTNEDGQVLYPTGSNDPAVEVRPDLKLLNVFGPDVTEQNMPVGAPNDTYWLMPSAGFNEIYVPIPEGIDIEEFRQEAESHGTHVVNDNWYAAPLSLFVDNALRMKVHVTQKVPTLYEATVICDGDKEADSNINGSMFIVTEPAKHSLAFYAKKEDETDAWYTVQTGSAVQPVDLPAFTAISDADIEAAFEA